MVFRPFMKAVEVTLGQRLREAYDMGNEAIKCKLNSSDEVLEHMRRKITTIVESPLDDGTFVNDLLDGIAQRRVFLEMADEDNDDEYAVVEGDTTPSGSLSQSVTHHCARRLINKPVERLRAPDNMSYSAHVKKATGLCDSNDQGGISIRNAVNQDRKRKLQTGISIWNDNAESQTKRFKAGDGCMEPREDLGKFPEEHQALHPRFHVGSSKENEPIEDSLEGIELPELPMR